MPLGYILILRVCAMLQGKGCGFSDALSVFGAIPKKGLKGLKPNKLSQLSLLRGSGYLVTGYM